MLQTHLLSKTPSAALRAEVRLPQSLKSAASCASCSLKSVCLPCNLGAEDTETFSALARLKRKIGHGVSLFHAAERLEALYIVRSGAFKTVRVSRAGDQKVTGFYFPGEVLGLDAIGGRTHENDAIALEDSEVCVVPFEHLERMSAIIPALQQQLFRVMSSDISRDQGLMLLMGAMSAEQRIAAFLSSLSRRYKRLGYSADRFVLRMQRQDIGSYLGLQLETVSRVLSKFNKSGLIAIDHREVEIRNPEALQEVLGAW